MLSHGMQTEFQYIRYVQQTLPEIWVKFWCDSMKNELFTANCGYIPAKVNQWPKYSYLLQSHMKIIDFFKDYSHFHVNSSKSVAVDTKNKFGQIQFHKTFIQE